MKRNRRPLIPQRRRMFFGCEGESERGYGALVSRWIESRRRDIHLDIVLLKPGGGDPLALIELAARLIREGERKRDAPYVQRAVLLDMDRIGQAPARDARVREVAAASKIRLIWQRPCHEALLLRHLDGCRDLRPPTSELSMQELRRRWPEYEKGMPAGRLATRIGDNELRRALEVEQELAAFLADIGCR